MEDYFRRFFFVPNFALPKGKNNSLKGTLLRLCLENLRRSEELKQVRLFTR